MITPENRPEQERLTPQEIFTLGREVATRGESLSQAGRPENLSFRGLLPDGRKIRVSYVQNAKQSDLSFLEKHSENVTASINIEHVYIAGADIFTSISRCDKVQGKTLQTEKDVYHLKENDNPLSLEVEEILRNIQPDTSPVVKQRPVREQQPGETVFCLTVPDRYGSQETGLTVPALSKEEATKRFIEDSAVVEDYASISSIRRRFTWLERQAPTYDDWYR